MKCPKCGYNSFDYLDSCKKCNKDLTEHKTRFNIQSILLSEMPAEAVATAIKEVATVAETAFDDFAGSSSEENAEGFGFDFMGDSEEDESLAFDELFEDVASEDDIEETLPAPEKTESTEPLEPKLTNEEDSLDLDEPIIDEFSFDEPEPDTPLEEATADKVISSAEFGFDADDDPAADIFAETEEDFSLDAIDFEDPDKK